MVMTCAAGTPLSTDFSCLSVIAPKVVEYAFASDRTDASALDSTQVPRLCGFAKMKREGTGILVYFCPPEINFMSMAPPGWVAKIPDGSVRIRLPLLAKFSFWKFESVHAFIVPLQRLEADQIGCTGGVEVEVPAASSCPKLKLPC